MRIEFECQDCARIFNGEVGNITFSAESERPDFAKPIMCPHCGERTMDQVWLTERGQSQLSDAVFGSR